MAFVHRQSCEGLKSELDLFAVPMTQTSIEFGQWDDHQPLTALDAGGTIEFLIPGSGDDYTDMASVRLYARVKVVQGDGTDIAHDSVMAPVNNFLHSMFSQVDLSLNGTLVTPSTNTYPYRAYIETLLSYGTDAKRTHFGGGMWYKDTAGFMEAVANANNGYAQRRAFTQDNHEVEMMGRLHVDMFMQDRYLLNGVDVKVRLVRSKDSFALIGANVNPGWKIVLLQTYLQVRKAKVHPSVQLGHIKALARGAAKYHLPRIDCKVFSVPQGTMSHTHEKVYLGVLPKRVFLALIDNDAYNGAYDKNPFNAKHNDINFLALYVDGRQVRASRCTRTSGTDVTSVAT